MNQFQMAASGSFAALYDAYQAALYEVELNGAVLVIGVDQLLPPALEARLVAGGVDEAAFLTAANPGSRQCDDEQNANRHAELLIALARLDVTWLEGNGRDAAGQWPAEPSVLALGLGAKQAMRLAQQFGQYAYVEVVRGVPARLRLTARGRMAAKSAAQT